MKKISFIFAVTLATILLVTSCGKQAPHLNVIPANSFGVITINPANFEEDKMADQLESNEEFKETMIKMREESEVLADIFEDFIKNPNSSGIDLKSEMFIFSAPNNKDMMFGMVAKVANSSNLEDIIKKVAKEMEMEIIVEDVDGFKKVEFPMGFGIAIWDKDKILILGSDSNDFDAIVKAKELMNQKVGESIISDKDFSDFYSDCLDLNIWISSNIKNLKTEMGMAEKFIGFDLNDNYAHIHFGWDKDAGEFTTIFKLRVNEEIRDMDYEDIQKLIEETDALGNIENILGNRSNSTEQWEEEWEEDLDDATLTLDSISNEDIEKMMEGLDEAIEEVEN